MITIPGMTLYDLLASVTREHHHLYPFQHGVGGCIAYGLGALYRAWVKSRNTGVIDVCIYTAYWAIHLVHAQENSLEGSNIFCVV
jgi:hypothetical protein